MKIVNFSNVLTFGANSGTISVLLRSQAWRSANPASEIQMKEEKN